MNTVLVNPLARIAFMNQSNSGVSQYCRLNMRHECSTGELVARDAFVHHDDKEASTLKRYAVLKWLNTEQTRYNSQFLNISYPDRQAH